MLDMPLTVRFSDITQTHSWAETIANVPRTSAKAFCENCTTGGRLFRVRSLEGIAIEVRSRGASCPRCGHALFWSRHYEEILRG